MADQLRLKSYDPSTGAVVYLGEAQLGGGRMLTFEVHGNFGTEYNKPCVHVKLDPFEAASFEEALRRMGVWLEAVARVFRGTPQNAGPPRVWSAESVPSPEST